MKSDCNPIEMGIIPEGCSLTPALLDTCGNEFARHFSHCKSESFLEIDRQLEPDPEAGKSKLIAQCSKWENNGFNSNDSEKFNTIICVRFSAHKF